MLTNWKWARNGHDNGQIVGQQSCRDDDGDGTYDRGSVAFLYTPGTDTEPPVVEGMKDLGTLSGDDSEAYGINVWGDVVGMAQVNAEGAMNPFVAFVFTDDLGMLELEPLIVDLPAELSGQIAPWRINDAGQISGPFSDNFNFSGQAFLLSPLP